jgi:ABC-type nitrate/sulfonate/bicarbonate transport system substrate-binding protein
MQTTDETPAPEITPKRKKGRPRKYDHDDITSKVAAKYAQTKKWQEENRERYNELCMKSYRKNREERLAMQAQMRLAKHIDKITTLTIAKHLITARERLTEDPEPVTTDEDLSD